jgi:hypothetical protein
VVAPINAERLHHFDAIFGHFIEGKNSVLCANTLLFLPVNKLLLAVLNFRADYFVIFALFKPQKATHDLCWSKDIYYDVESFTF